MHVSAHALRLHSESTGCYPHLNRLAADMARVSTCMSSLAMSFILGELDIAADVDADIGTSITEEDRLRAGRHERALKSASMVDDDAAAAAGGDGDGGAVASSGHDDVAAAVAAGGDGDGCAVAASGHDDVAAAVAVGGDGDGADPDATGLIWRAGASLQLQSQTSAQALLLREKQVRLEQKRIQDQIRCVDRNYLVCKCCALRHEKAVAHTLSVRLP